MSRAEFETDSNYVDEYDSREAGGAHQESPVAIARRLLRGRWRVAAVLGIALGAGCAAAGYLGPRPLYRAFGVVEVVSHQQTILFNLSEKGIPPMFDALVDTNASLVKDPRVVSDVMRSDAWRDAGRGLSAEEIQGFQASLSAARIKRTPLIEVSFVDPDPAVAQGAVNGVIDAFLTKAKEREQISGETRDSKLANERVDLQGQIQDLREQERARSEGYGAEWIDDKCSRLTNDLDALDRRIAAKRLQIEGLTITLPARREQGTVEREITAESIAATNVHMATLLQTRSAAETRLDVLTNDLGLGRREVRVLATRAQLEKANEQIAAVVGMAQEEATKARAKAANAPSTASEDDVALARCRAELVLLEESRDTVDADLKPFVKMRTRLGGIVEEREQAQAALRLVHDRLRQLQVEFGGADSSSGTENWTGQVRRVHEAEWPGAPYKDRRTPYAIVGALGGLGLGILLVAIYGFIRGQMRHVEDVVGGESRERFLAIVPDIGTAATDATARTSLEMTEYCVHHLRTLIQVRNESEARSIALTSPSAGAGKTTVGMALALSFGATGSRTLLVDADLVGHGLTSATPSIVCEGARSALEACSQYDTLDVVASDADAEAHVRRAFASRDTRVSDDEVETMLHRVRDAATTGSSRARAAFRALETTARYMGVNGFAPGRRMGILDVLGGAGIEECVLETGFANVSVLPIGDARPTDAERLSPQHVKRLLRTCHEQYDTVILDTGPVLGSLEASFVAAVADEVVFVVARGEPRRPADEALKRLDRLGATVSGIVFNRALIGDVVRSSYSSRSESVAAGSE